MHYMQSWATEDFDLFDFIGDDPEQTFSGNASQNGDPYAYQNNQFDQLQGKDEKADQMYTAMQYNDLLIPHDNNQQMYGNHDMSNGFLQDDRYQNTPNSSLLNNTINKLHLQQQQQNQPSTSRLSNVVSNNQPPQQSYSNGANKMRMNNNLFGGPQPQDLSENVLLPTSSMSPQNNGSMYVPQQTAIKLEPGYELSNAKEYFDSTSDAESQYSTGGRSLNAGSSSNKPRKYRIKPESERLNPQYRMKRAKNNDAVRRSREKAKLQQVEKEKRLSFLETEHNEHYKQMNTYRQRVRELEAELKQVRAMCNCGAAQQQPPQVFRR